MDPYVIFLDGIEPGMIPQVGGKAANLGLLTGWGFRVPGGFCVRAAALDDAIREAGLGERIRDLAAGLTPSDLVAMEEITGWIRGMIEAAPMPPKVESAIRWAYEGLRARSDRDLLVAVRSSVGTRDGGRSSFPGQMDTYHNLRGVEQVIEAIRRCWASAWTVRAACTRLRLGLGPEDVIIAPLVQEMVQSDTAGVLFTANPITGNRNEVLINASYGLGESVVSGTLTPDEYVFEKDTLREVRRRIGHKPFQVVLDEKLGSGTMRVEHGEEIASRPCLTAEQCAELVETGIRIEEKYGGKPQDVEWAFHRGRLYILQSRAVSAIKETAHGPEGSENDRIPDEREGEFDTRVSCPPCLYTSANISEVLPGVLTPLTCSGLKALDYGFWKSNHDLGLCRVPFPEDPKEMLFLGLFYGRPHLNLSRFREMACQIPGAAAAEFDRPLPEEEAGSDPANRFRLTPRSLGVFARFVWNGRKMLRRVPRDLEALSEVVTREYREFRDKDLADLSVEALWGMIERHEGQEALDVMALHIDNSSLAVGFYELLRKLCSSWLDDEAGTLASRLVTGLTTLESARPNREIFQLHDWVRRSAYLTDRFLRLPPEELGKLLEEDPHPDVFEFRGRLRAFLFRYGYRSVNEAELMLPSWEQDPGFVISMIRSLVSSPAPEDPHAVELRRAKERETTVAEARGRLSMLQWIPFKWVLDRTQVFIAGRERNKALLMMGVHGVKRVVSELSGRLERQGLLRERRDVYFLTMEEVGRLCRGESFDAGERILRRRLEWERNRGIRLPETFRGRPRPLASQDLENSFNAGDGEVVLRGLSVSPGRVTGKARVITDPRIDAHIEAGEILVAPVTDAGWTPLFLLASGLVVDVGGLLSHGSIVAREYGIPGVLNVFSATRRIRTGQMITVDGDKGEVWIHGEDG